MFVDLSLRRKLVLVVLMTSGIALLLASAVTVSLNLRDAREQLVRSIALLAEVTAANSTAAITFEDPKDAAEVLASLKAEPSIRAASIHRLDGSMVASYLRPGEPPSRWPSSRRQGGLVLQSPAGPLPIDPLEIEHHWLDDALIVARPVMLGGEPIGSLYVNSDLRQSRQALVRSLSGAALAVVVALLLALVPLWRLERLLTGPLLQLLDTMRRVSREQSYAVRASATGRDEVGALVAAFNEMLHEVETRDQQLRQQREGLEQTVQNRTRRLRELNQALIEAKERAEAANRAKTSFLANMSHELRTPLHAILGYTQLLQETSATPGQPFPVEDLDKIEGAGKHLLSVINEVLDLSRIEAGKMTVRLSEFDVADLVHEVVATLQPLADAREHRLVVACPDDIGRMRSDLVKLRQCLYNLLSNACKFSYRGEVRLEISRTRRKACDWFQFAVNDTGTGIDPSASERVWDPFYQVESASSQQSGGTGLGLTITRRYCEMLGGTVGLDSSPGRGSRFWIELPDITPEKPQPAADTPPDPARAAEPAVDAGAAGEQTRGKPAREPDGGAGAG